MYSRWLILQEHQTDDAEDFRFLFSFNKRDKSHFKYLNVVFQPWPFKKSATIELNHSKGMTASMQRGKQTQESPCSCNPTAFLFSGKTTATHCCHLQAADKNASSFTRTQTPHCFVWCCPCHDFLEAGCEVEVQSGCCCELQVHSPAPAHRQKWKWDTSPWRMREPGRKAKSKTLVT